MHNLHFYEVLEILLVTKERIKARREKWPEGMYVVAMKDPVLNGKKVLEHHTRLERKEIGYDNDLVISRWSPNSEGLLADDWIIEYQ